MPLSDSVPTDGSSTRPAVIHLGEVAGVARTLVDGLASRGFPAGQRHLPAPAPDSNLVLKGLLVAPRVSAAIRLRSELKRLGAIAHVHYATSGIWFLGSHPLVVHCHGTDVRAPGGVQRRVLDRVFSSADLVIAATPDLLDWLPDGARYLPNPIDTDLFAPAEVPGGPTRDILVFAALTDIKGAPEILRMVTELKRARPELRITAIDHGQHAASFRAAGVEMVGFLDMDELPALIGDHRLVLGQRVLGVPGTSELQAMAVGRPVVMPLSDAVDPAVLPPTISEDDAVVAAEHVLQLLEEPGELERLGNRSRTWVVANHGIDSVTRRLIGWYGEIS